MIRSHSFWVLHGRPLLLAHFVLVREQVILELDARDVLCRHAILTYMSAREILMLEPLYLFRLGQPQIHPLRVLLILFSLRILSHCLLGALCFCLKTLSLIGWEIERL